MLNCLKYAMVLVGKVAGYASGLLKLRCLLRCRVVLFGLLYLVSSVLRLRIFGLGLPVVLFFTCVWGADVYALPKHRYYEVALDIEVEGQRFSWSNVFECYHFDPKIGNPLGMKVAHGYRLKYLSMAKRLPSGAGLIAVPPDFCQTDTARWGIEKPQPGPDYSKYMDLDHPPTIYWLDNAETPTQIEGYFARTYFDHPEARVKLHAVSARTLEDGKRVDPRKEVPWIRKRKEPGETWSALAVDIVPFEDWSKYPVIKAALQPYLTVSKPVNLLNIEMPKGEGWINDPDRPWFRNALGAYMHQAFIKEDKIKVSSRGEAIAGGLNFSKHLIIRKQDVRKLPLFVNEVLFTNGFYDFHFVLDPRRKFLIWPRGRVIVVNNYLLSEKY